MTPNANCPACGARVYFYSNSSGSRVFFDQVGPPWQKHPCTDRARPTASFFHQLRIDEIGAKYRAKIDVDVAVERDGWKLFKILRTRSFRYEIEHHFTAKRFETDLVKDQTPIPSVAIWIRGIDQKNIEISYFDMENFCDVTLRISPFEVRKFASIANWSPFQLWFDAL